MENLTTKEKIALAALKAFLRSGYRDVSLKDIVAEIGITKGAFYHYFKSKEELFIEVIESYCFGFFNEFQKIISDPQIGLKEKIDQTSELLIILLDYNKREGIEYGSFLLLLYDAMKRFDNLNEKISSLYHISYELLFVAFDKARQEGIIKKEMDVEALAMQSMTLIEGILLMSEVFDSQKLKKNIPSIVSNFWIGIKVED